MRWHLKLTNQEIIAVINVVNELSQKELPFNLAFDLYNIHAKCMDYYASYIKTLDKQMRKEGVDTPDKLENQEEVGKLLARTVNVPAKKVKLSDFEGINGLTVAQVSALRPIIDG